jgi:hypothetical protein
MATFLSSVALAAALLQAPGSPAPGSAPDGIAAARARLAQDSGDGRAWLALGRGYLRAFRDAQGRPTPRDSGAPRAVLDAAERALRRAALLLGPPGSSAEGDSARVLRVETWRGLARLAVNESGVRIGTDAWGPAPPDLRLSPVLEELGENLLRACPTGGVLVTADDADTPAAWYMRSVRGLRPDLALVPLADWQADAAWRARLAAHWKLRPRAARDGWLAALAQQRPVCVSMAFEQPPQLPTRARLQWEPRPLVWVAGPEHDEDRVPSGDFAFAALRLALDAREAWAHAARAVYTRAARLTPALCETLARFELSGEQVGCS